MYFDAKEEHGTGQRFIRSSHLQKKKNGSLDLRRAEESIGVLWQIQKKKNLIKT